MSNQSSDEQSTIKKPRRLYAGGSDDSIMHWLIDEDSPIDERKDVHGATVNCLAWHPIGHLLVSVGSDASVKFWARSQPGDVLCGRMETTTLGPNQAGQTEAPHQVRLGTAAISLLCVMNCWMFYPYLLDPYTSQNWAERLKASGADI
jgi:WD40 repeat protein